jgi:hypothetical protein
VTLCIGGLLLDVATLHIATGADESNDLKIVGEGFLGTHLDFGVHASNI